MRIAKWGNSLAVRLPSRLVSNMRLRHGDAVELIPAGAATLALRPDTARQEALARLHARGWAAPKDLAWSRDDANAR